jgi:hypothetical protein
LKSTGKRNGLPPNTRVLSSVMTDWASNNSSRWNRNDLLATLALIAITILVYGPFLRFTGFYWDDWPVVWVYSSHGAAGLKNYFAGNRPVVGWLFARLFPVLGIRPFGWQLLSLATRGASSITVFVALRALWPQLREIAWTTAAFVLVYPGFTQQPIALTYLPHHLSFLLFVLSLFGTIVSIRSARYRWMALGLALLAEGASYLLTEYFLGLELFRVMVIWLLAEDGNRRKKAKAALLRWSPYAALWVLYVFLRSVVLPTAPSASYKDAGSGMLRILKHPFHAVPGLLSTELHNIPIAAVAAWARPFVQDFTAESRSALLAWGIAAMVSSIALYALRALRQANTADDESLFVAKLSRQGRKMACLVACGLVVAGLPFLISGLRAGFEIQPSYTDRMTLPFVLPASLAAVSLFAAVSSSRRVRLSIVILFLFVCSAFQVQNGNFYRKDWIAQKLLFWQFAWRAPALEEGTSIFAVGLPKSLYRNHSAGLLDLLYSHQPSVDRMHYFIYDLEHPPEDGGVPSKMDLNYAPGMPVTGAVRSFEFSGTVGHSIVGWISPRGMLRIVTPSHPNEILLCPALCSNLAQVSQPQKVIHDSQETPAGPLLAVFGIEPKLGWPYFYQRAELERQFKNWDAVAALGDEAKRHGNEPVDPSEWFPFIDGYARAGKYAMAEDLSRQMIEQAPDAFAPLSELWSRVIRDNPSNPAELDSAKRVFGKSFDFAHQQQEPK